MKALNCPRGHNKMKLHKITKTVNFRGMEIPCHVEAYTPRPECGMEAGTVNSAGAIQQQLADVLPKTSGLLTGEDIKSLGEKKRINPTGLG